VKEATNGGVSIYFYDTMEEHKIIFPRVKEGANVGFFFGTTAEELCTQQ
jgi:hypothetical protein